MFLQVDHLVCNHQTLPALMYELLPLITSFVKKKKCMKQHFYIHFLFGLCTKDQREIASIDMNQQTSVQTPARVSSKGVETKRLRNWHIHTQLYIHQHRSYKHSATGTDVLPLRTCPGRLHTCAASVTCLLSPLTE